MQRCTWCGEQRQQRPCALVPRGTCCRDRHACYERMSQLWHNLNVLGFSMLYRRRAGDLLTNVENPAKHDIMRKATTRC